MPRLVAVAVLVVASACASASRRQAPNVNPPHPGVPASAADVQGIYRTGRQGTLQLRGNGTLVIVTDRGPDTGSYVIEGGRMEVQSRECAEAGTYHVRVGGVPEPGKAVLHLTALRDDCAERRASLGSEPWVYANS